MYFLSHSSHPAHLPRHMWLVASVLGMGESTGTLSDHTYQSSRNNPIYPPPIPHSLSPDFDF